MYAKGTAFCIAKFNNGIVVQSPSPKDQHAPHHVTAFTVDVELGHEVEAQQHHAEAKQNEGLVASGAERRAVEATMLPTTN
jgi:hypothetical protein